MAAPVAQLSAKLCDVGHSLLNGVMSTAVPTEAELELPPWLWGGSFEGFLSSARLRWRLADTTSRRVFVEAIERHTHERPQLVVESTIVGPTLDRPQFEILTKNEQAHLRSLPPDATPDQALLQEHVARMARRVDAAAGTDNLAPGISLHQLQTFAAVPEALAPTVRTIVEDLRDIKFRESNEALFPNVSAHLIRREPALMHRAQLPAILLRLEHDPRLRASDLAHVLEASSQGALIFAASSGHNEGIALLDAYLGPLLGCLTPFIWAFPSTRASGTIVYGLGRALPGAPGEASELLQVLPARGAAAGLQTPPLSPRAVTATITWWVRRLDRLMSVISDPAVFSSSDRRYVPSKHLHALLSFDQLFRRVASIQRSHRDADARRVLLFTVLDTLERLTSRSLVEMCTLAFAERTLNDLRKSVSADVAQLLIPCAQRGVDALRELQRGFFLSQQLGTSEIAFTDSTGAEQRLAVADAAAEYVRVLRNATHGHGSNRELHTAKTDALLSHHDGALSHDLGLLGYLYLLELMTKPDLLRRTLYNGGRS